MRYTKGRAWAVSLTIGCSVFAVDAACAQSASASVDAASAPAAENDQSTATGDIIVTARRRDESLQTVPLAVTVLTPNSLRDQNVTNTMDLVRVTPNLQIRANGAQRQDNGFFIRGQGATYGSQPGVIAYFNEVPQFNTLIGNNVQFYDLENIQVLKGPQGTLFGRSTTGGAVLISPQRPTNRFEGFGEFKIGNYGMREFTGALNLPIINDVLKLRVAGNILRRNGFTINANNGEDLDNKRRDSYRISLAFTPGDEFEMLTIFRGEKVDENATGVVMVDYDERHARYNPAVYGPTIAAVCGALNPVNLVNRAACVATRTERMQSLVTALAAQEAFVRAGAGSEYPVNLERIRLSPSAIDSVFRGHVQQLSHVITIRPGSAGFLGDLRIKDIFATNRVVYANSYRSVAGAPLLNADTANGYDIINGQLVATKQASEVKFFDNFSNELQLGGDSTFMDWVVGYYVNKSSAPVLYPPFFATYNTAFNTTTPLDVGAIQGQLTLNAKSLDKGYYGQATIRPIDNLSITAGYRWSHFTRTAQTSTPQVTANGLVPTTLVDSPAVSDKASSYNFAVDYRVTPDMMVYVTHRKGFKPGGANLPPTTATPGFIANFDPETVKDVEAGIKYSWRGAGWSGRANLAVFTTNYSNIQRNQVLGGGAQVVTQINNIAKAKIDGLELETVFNIGERLTLGINYAYLNARYTEYPGTTTDILGNVRNRIDTPFVGTPKHSGSANVRYTLIDAPETGKLSLSGNLYAQSVSFVDDGALENPVQFGRVPGYTQLGGRIDWTNVMGTPVDLGLFVTNATDEVHIQGAAGLATALGMNGGIFSEPRFYGASVRVNF